MDNDETYLFSKMPVSKAILKLSIPTVISQFITVVYNMADTFFIGQLNDPLQVASATIAMPIFMFLTAFANLFGLGGSSMISRCLGANDHEKAKHTAAFSIYGGALIALVYGILIVVLQSLILPLLGAGKDTWNYCSQYIFWTIGIGALPTVLNPLFAHLIRCEGHSTQAGFGVALGGILNCILDPVFIFVFDLKIQGAAIATMLSNVIATFYFIVFIYKRRHHSVITLDIKQVKIDFSMIKEVITVGLPGFLMTMMSTISNAVLNFMIASYSATAIAGMGIAKKIDLLAYAIAQGMTQGTLPLIGYNYSSHDHKRLKLAIKTAFLYSFIVAFSAAVFLFVFAGMISQCFISDVETVNYSIYFLRIICLACPTTAINFMIITVFQATGKKKEPMFLSLLRKGSIHVVLMLLLNSFLGIQGIAWATPFADWMAFVISIGLYFNFMKNIKHV